MVFAVLSIPLRLVLAAPTMATLRMRGCDGFRLPCLTLPQPDLRPGRRRPAMDVERHGVDIERRLVARHADHRYDLHVERHLHARQWRALCGCAVLGRGRCRWRSSRYRGVNTGC